MPPALLESQFKTLEPPGASEGPIIADIAPPVEEIVDHIVAQLALGPVDRSAHREERA
jgi:gluconate kinase